MITKYLSIEGWFNLFDAYLNLVKKVPGEGSIVEIGSFKGRSTRFLCDALVTEEKTKLRFIVLTPLKEHQGSMTT